jgi:hypothetical protein
MIPCGECLHSSIYLDVSNVQRLSYMLYAAPLSATLSDRPEGVWPLALLIRPPCGDILPSSHIYSMPGLEISVIKTAFETTLACKRRLSQQA